MDEVICGFGWIGNWFGFEIVGICLYIMIIVKGLLLGYVLIGGLIVCDEVVKIVNVNGDFNYGYIYLGYFVVVVVVFENLCILEEE